jgi:hypothetical protein
VSNGLLNVSLIPAGSTLSIPLTVTNLTLLNDQLLRLETQFPSPLNTKGASVDILFNTVPKVNANPLSTLSLVFPFQGLEYKKNDNLCYASGFVSAVFIIGFCMTLPFIGVVARRGLLLFVQTLSVLGFLSLTLNADARVYYYCYSATSFNFFKLPPVSSPVPNPLLSSLGLVNTPLGLGGGAIIFGFIFFLPWLLCLIFRKRLPALVLLYLDELAHLPILFGVFSASQYISTTTSNNIPV